MLGRLRSEEGAVLVAGLLLTIVMMFVIGFAVDVGRAFIARRDLASIADQAVLTGSQAIDLAALHDGRVVLDPALARANALRPDLYPDPLVFRPERFLDTRAGTYTWIPFGGGPRRCLGAAFSLIETRIVLRTMLRHAHLLPTRRPPERIARHTVTIVPAHGATITLERRPASTGPT